MGDTYLNTPSSLEALLPHSSPPMGKPVGLGNSPQIATGSFMGELKLPTLWRRSELSIFKRKDTPDIVIQESAELECEQGNY